jgi:hypothetical protein
MPTYLKGIRDIADSTLCDNLEASLQEFFNYGLLCIGAFNNVYIGISGTYPGEESRLRLVEDKNYLMGQVWEGYRTNWVWESGIPLSSSYAQPIQVSGVYIDDVFYPASTTGTYAHHVDYPRGRIVFDNPISPSAVVEAEYTFRLFNIDNSDAPWFRQVMFNSLRIDQQANQFLQYGSGVYSIISDHRVQLPAVVVEVSPRRTMEGYQLGGGMNVNQDVLFHIFTEYSSHRKKLLDIITYQNGGDILGFDKNLIAQQGRYSLSSEGSILPGALTYPDLIKPVGNGGFFWRQITFNSVSSQESISAPPLFQAVIRGTFGVRMPEI